MLTRDNGNKDDRLNKINVEQSEAEYFFFKKSAENNAIPTILCLKTKNNEISGRK